MVASVSWRWREFAWRGCCTSSAPNLPGRSRRNAGGSTDLVSHKYYVDEIYDAMFVNRTKDLGSSLGVFDAKVIDGVGVNGAGWLTRAISRDFDVVGHVDCGWLDTSRRVADLCVELSGAVAARRRDAELHAGDCDRTDWICGLLPVYLLH